MVLRAAGRLSAITAAYEAASAAVPHDLGLLQEVFGAHVRWGVALWPRGGAREVRHRGGAPYCVQGRTSSCDGSCMYIQVRGCQLQSETKPTAGTGAGNSQGVAPITRSSSFSTPPHATGSQTL